MILKFSHAGGSYGRLEFALSYTENLCQWKNLFKLVFNKNSVKLVEKMGNPSAVIGVSVFFFFPPIIGIGSKNRKNWLGNFCVK